MGSGSVTGDVGGAIGPKQAVASGRGNRGRHSCRHTARGPLDSRGDTESDSADLEQ